MTEKWWRVCTFVGDIKATAYEGPVWAEAVKIIEGLKANCAKRIVLETWVMTPTMDISYGYLNEYLNDGTSGRGTRLGYYNTKKSA